MKMMSKSFPKLQFIFVFIIVFLQFCQNEKTLTINKEQFIEIYARILIINELKVEKSFQNRLLQELYIENNVTSAEIDSSVSYYNSNSREWVEIYNRVREKIQKIRSDYKTESSKKLDSLLSKPKSKLSTKSYRKSFIGDQKEKDLIDQRKKRKKPEVKKPTDSNINKEKSD
jgi:hypothetical protein